jgi:hypothetical protein
VDAKSGTSRPVIEHLDGAPVVARVSVRRPHGTGAGAVGSVSWELCYGDVPIAGAVIGIGEAALAIDVPMLEPWMDDVALSVTAWSETGDPVPVEATCARAARRLTSAEATARAVRPGLRSQLEVPQRGEAFVAEQRMLLVPRPPAPSPNQQRAARSVVLYQDVHRLLAHRRERLRGASRDRTDEGGERGRD